MIKADRACYQDNLTDKANRSVSNEQLVLCNRQLGVCNSDALTIKAGRVGYQNNLFYKTNRSVSKKQVATHNLMGAVTVYLTVTNKTILVGPM